MIDHQSLWSHNEFGCRACHCMSLVLWLNLKILAVLGVGLFYAHALGTMRNHPIRSEYE
jgi:hypothetical protein